jgi:hypothetical protein
MIILTSENIIDSKNIKIIAEKINYSKTININKELHYLSLNNNYIYCKTINTDIIPNNEKTIRFNISNPLEPIEDISFGKSYGVASHNMYFFKDKQGKTKAIGGQHYGIGNYEDDIRKNNNYDEYHKSISFINARPYQITMSGCHAIYNHNQSCPYYANGLHLFAEVNNDLVCLNNNLPIISGVHPGRYDGHYGHTNNSTLESCRNGLSVYDSLGSIVYNKEKDLYFMYHRANIGTGRRSIQYSTSKNLLEWGEFNIVNFGQDHDHFGCNMYYSNFFNIPDTNIYLGIIPYIKRVSSEYNSVDTKEEYRLYYSYNCVNYKYVGNVHENNEIKSLENNYLITNLSYYFDNKMFFYIFNQGNFNIYTMKKNRYMYVTNELFNESYFKIKLENNKEIKLNINVESNGYLQLELLDENKNPIEEFTFNDFNKIIEIDSIDYIINWNNKTIIPNNSVYISFKFINARIYSIF